MKEKFKINDIVKIKKKTHGLNVFFSFGQMHYRSSNVGETGKIFSIEKDIIIGDNRYVPVRFDVIKIWVYHENGYPSIYLCMENEIVKASKIEIEKYKEAEEKYNARILAEKL